MATMTRHRAVAWLTATLLIGQLGCSSIRPRPAEHGRGDARTVGLAWARFAPDVAIEVPVTHSGSDTAKAAAKGAAKGAGYTLLGGAYCAGGAVIGGREAGVLLAGACLALGIGLAPVGALVGGMYGIVKAKSAAESNKRTPARKRPLARVDVQEMLRSRTLQVARDRLSRDLVSIVDKGPAWPGENVDYRSLVGEGVDTVLEIGVSKVSLVGDQGIDAPLALLVTARITHIQTLDGARLHAYDTEYRSGARSLAEWAAHDARPLRQELDHAILSFADDVIDLVRALRDPGPQT